jgi:hypothetical protein
MKVIAMRPDDLIELIRRQPFAPFRLHVTGGISYDVHHPDQIIVLRSRAVLGVGGDNGVSDRLEHIALVHVVRMEELPAKSTNGPTD